MAPTSRRNRSATAHSSNGQGCDKEGGMVVTSLVATCGRGGTNSEPTTHARPSRDSLCGAGRYSARATGSPKIHPAACSQDGRKADTSRNALAGGGDEPPPQCSKNRQSLVCQVRDYRERPPRKEKAKLGSSTGGTLQVTRQRPWTRVCYCDY